MARLTSLIRGPEKPPVGARLEAHKTSKKLTSVHGRVPKANFLYFRAEIERLRYLTRSETLTNLARRRNLPDTLNIPYLDYAGSGGSILQDMSV